MKSVEWFLLFMVFWMSMHVLHAAPKKSKQIVRPIALDPCKDFK